MNINKEFEDKHEKKQINTLFPLAGVVLLSLVVSYTFIYKGGKTNKKLSKGELIFNENCASCHGIGAVGEDPENHKMGGTKEDGSYIAPALNGTAHAFHHSNELLFKTIKSGSSAKNSAMIGFDEILNNDEIHEVMHYFKSLWPEEIQERHSRR